MNEIVNTLSDEERLGVLIQDYYDQVGRGCLSGIRDLVTGRSKKRTAEIGSILGIFENDVMQLFLAVNLISLLPTKEKTLEKAHNSFLKGTRGGESTGSSEGDKRIEKIALFTRIAIDKRWELKQIKLR